MRSCIVGDDIVESSFSKHCGLLFLSSGLQAGYTDSSWHFVRASFPVTPPPILLFSKMDSLIDPELLTLLSPPPEC